ncbi:hypothetical protein V5O48_016850 [Marasmius crinis-equi]|uniref:Uncharacterized protein n=1 Tax=Marasmius crinis-equi TaxID=585013 RepID=A0ABR3EQL1_9AGAR
MAKSKKSPDSDSKASFTTAHQKVIQEHYLDEFRDFILKVDPTLEDSRNKELRNWYTTKANAILALINSQTAPFDKCPPLDENKVKADIDACKRVFWNYRNLKLKFELTGGGSTGGITAKDARKAIDRLLDFASGMTGRKLFESENKDIIIEESKALGLDSPAAAYQSQLASMWHEAPQEEWNEKAKNCFDIGENQKEFPKLLTLMLQTLAQAGYIGDFETVFVTCIRDANGKIDTTIGGGGTSKMNFLKTWKDGADETTCAEEAAETFGSQVAEWTKRVLPPLKQEEREDGIDLDVFEKTSGGLFRFPDIDTKAESPKVVGSYIKAYFELVHKEQYNKLLNWTVLTKNPDTFYDTTKFALKVCLVDPQDMTSAQICDLADTLHNLPTPFAFRDPVEAPEVEPPADPESDSKSAQDDTHDNLGEAQEEETDDGVDGLWQEEDLYAPWGGIESPTSGVADQEAGEGSGGVNDEQLAEQNDEPLDINPEAQQEPPSKTPKNAGRPRKPRVKKAKEVSSNQTQNGSTGNKRKRSEGFDTEETQEKQGPVKRSRKQNAPPPEPHTETHAQQALNRVVIKGKKGKDAANWTWVAEPEDKAGSLQITPKKPTVEGRVSTRRQARVSG